MQDCATLAIEGYFRYPTVLASFIALFWTSQNLKSIPISYTSSYHNFSSLPNSTYNIKLSTLSSIPYSDPQFFFPISVFSVFLK